MDEKKVTAVAKHRISVRTTIMHLIEHDDDFQPKVSFKRNGSLTCAILPPLLLIDGLSRKSFSYNKLPQEPLKLTVLKLDGTSFWWLGHGSLEDSDIGVFWVRSYVLSGLLHFIRHASINYNLVKTRKGKVVPEVERGTM
ncbi:hypothetical protein LguiA_036498 [Lonicera macranthoides]